MRKASKIDYGYNSTFPCRLRKIMDDNKTTQAALAKVCGVERQSVAQWRDGNTRPDILSLREIAIFFNVSTDWLLGITDIPAKDETLKGVCVYTGLSQEAVEKMAEYNQKANSTETLSKAMVFDEFWYIFNVIGSAISIDKKYLYPNINEFFTSVADEIELNSPSSKYLDVFRAVCISGLSPAYKQEIAEYLWRLFDKVVKKENEQKT